MWAPVYDINLNFNSANSRALTLSQVLLDIVRRVGGNYIQVIYDSTTAYATSLHDKLKQLAPDFDVCIANSIASVPQTDVSRYIPIKVTVELFTFTILALDLRFQDSPYACVSKLLKIFQ